GSLAVTGPGGRVALGAASGAAPFRFEATDLPVRFGAGEPATVSGGVTQAPDGTLLLAAELAPGGRLFGLPLVGGATLAGELPAGSTRLALRGALGEAPLVAAVDWSSGLTVEAAVAGLKVSLQPASGAWRLAEARPADAAPVEADAAPVRGSQGSRVSPEAPGAPDAPPGTDLAPLLAQLGLEGLDARSAGALAFEPGSGYAGAAALRLAAPVPVEARLTGAGERLDMAVAGELGGVPLAGSGAFTAPLLESFAAAVASPGAVDAPALLVDLGPLRAVTLDRRGLRGGGGVAATSVGRVTVGPVPWSRAFGGAAAAGFVELSGEAVALALREGAIE